MFPGRTNFEVARVLSKRKIEARMRERGVGETLACGSGACAIAVAAQLLDYVDRQVDIILDGGTLTASCFQRRRDKLVKVLFSLTISDDRFEEGGESPIIPARLKSSLEGVPMNRERNILDFA